MPVVPEVNVPEGTVDVDQPTNSSRQHALLDKYIVESVANYLPVQDLLQSKLVCKLWHSEMSRRLKQFETFETSLESEVEAKKLLGRKKVNEHLALSKITLIEIRFRENFCLMINNFGYLLYELWILGCEVNIEILKLLLTRQCPNLSKLVLAGNYYIEDPVNVPIALTTDGSAEQHALSRLHSLTLTGIRSPDDEDDYIPILLEDVVALFPNLEELDCIVLPSVGSAEIFLGYQWDSLCGLSIYEGTSDSILFFLQNSIQLNNLNFLCLSGLLSSSLELLKVFIDSVADSLQELCLYGEELPSETDILSIDLPNVKAFSVGSHYCNSFDVLAGIGSLEWFEFCAFSADCNFWKRVFDNSHNARRYPTVKILTLPQIDETAFERIVQMFPNLEVLVMEPHVEYSIEMWPVIDFNKLAQLWIEAIKINDKNVKESEHTGTLNKRDCYRIERHRNFGVDAPRKVGRSPFMDFVLDVNGFWYGGQHRLNDCVRFKKLTSLFIVDSQITDISLEIIKDSMPELKLLKLVRCPAITEVGLQSLQDLRKDVEIVVDNSE